MYSETHPAIEPAMPLTNQIGIAEWSSPRVARDQAEQIAHEDDAAVRTQSADWVRLCVQRHLI